MEPDSQSHNRPFDGLQDVDRLSTVRYTRSSLKVVRIEKPAEDLQPAANGPHAFPDVQAVDRELFGNTKNAGSRFSFIDALGEGSFGSVVLVRDENCSREVAVKIPKNCENLSKDDLLRFLGEARTTAGLQHPNIVPIYELNVDRNGTPYICMPMIKGRSLRNILAGDEEIGLNDLVAILAKVCDALTFAHDHGQLHQDVKPDNIMVGGYGEVFVIDWGSSSCSGDEMCATPAYMSPQQARGLNPTESDDVYCLGGALFECVFKRLPTTGETLDELIHKKQAGAIDQPTEDELNNVPRALAAIAMKALSPAPEQRYASVRELGADLRNYQHGLSVAAYQEPILVKLFRTIRRRWRPIAVATGAAVLLSTIGYMWHNERQKEVARWGAPVHTQNFNDNSWERDWTLETGRAEVIDGTLTMDGAAATVVYYKHKLRGNAAIEYDAWIEKDGIPGDISAIWGSEDSMEYLNSGLMFQVGARDNTFCSLTLKSKLLDLAPIRLARGRKYHIRCEIEGPTARVLLDGKKILEHTKIVPYTSGYFGLLSWYPSKHFDNVQIFSKGTALRVPAVQRGDALLAHGHHVEAIEEYEHVITSHPNTPVAHEARYKQGLCQFQNRDYDNAWKTWAPLRDTPWWPKVKHNRMLHQFMTGKFLTVMRDFRKAYPAGTPELREQLRQCWSEMIQTLVQTERWHLARDFLALREELFPKDPLTGYSYASTLVVYLREERTALERCDFHTWAKAIAYRQTGHPELILQKFPQYRTHFSEALYKLGHTDELLRNFPDAKLLCRDAIRALNLPFDEVLKQYPNQEGNIGELLLSEKRYNDVLSMTPEARGACASALVRLRRVEEALNKYPEQKRHIVKALLQSKQGERVLELFPDSSLSACRALTYLGRTGEAIKRYPERRDYLLRQLIRLERWKKILQYFPDAREECAQSLFMLKRYSDVISTYPDQHLPYVQALLRLNRLDDIIAHCPEDDVMVSHALLRQKRYNELISRDSTPPFIKAVAYAALGQARKAIACANTPVQLRRMSHAPPKGFENWEWTMTHVPVSTDGWTVYPLDDPQHPDIVAIQNRTIGIASMQDRDWQKSTPHLLIARELQANGRLTTKLAAMTRGKTLLSIAGLALISQTDSDSYATIVKIDGTKVGATCRQGDSKAAIATAPLCPDQYLRLERRGDSISCFSSVDGKDWTLRKKGQFPTGPVRIGFTAAARRTHADMSLAFFEDIVFEKLD